MTIDANTDSVCYLSVGHDSACLSHCVSFPVCLTACLSLSVSLRLCLTASLFHCVSLSLCVSLHVFFLPASTESNCTFILHLPLPSQEGDLTNNSNSRLVPTENQSVARFGNFSPPCCELINKLSYRVCDETNQHSEYDQTEKYLQQSNGISHGDVHWCISHGGVHWCISHGDVRWCISHRL